MHGMTLQCPEDEQVTEEYKENAIAHIRPYIGWMKYIREIQQNNTHIQGEQT